MCSSLNRRPILSALIKLISWKNKPFSHEQWIVLVGLLIDYTELIFLIYLYGGDRLYSTVRITSECRSRDCEFEPQLSHITFVEIVHEIISTSVLPLPLIKEGQLTFTEESICISTG